MTRLRLTYSSIAAFCLASTLCAQEVSPRRPRPEFPRAEIGIGLGIPHLVHLGASISPWKPVFVDGEVAAGMLSSITSQAQLIAGYQRMSEDGGAWRLGLGVGSGSRGGNFNGAGTSWTGPIASLSRIGLFDAMNGRWGYKAALSVGGAWDSDQRSYAIPLNGSIGLFLRIL